MYPLAGIGATVPRSAPLAQMPRSGQEVPFPMYRMTDEEFESAIEDALETIPERFLKALENIEIVMQDEPDEEQLASVEGDGWYDGPDGEYTEEMPDELFGLYEGIALPERGDYGWCEVPDVITIFKGPHERAFDSREQVVEEIGKTVIHEIGHYFGLDDDKLYEMGY